MGRSLIVFVLFTSNGKIIRKLENKDATDNLVDGIASPAVVLEIKQPFEFMMNFERPLI